MYDRRINVRNVKKNGKIRTIVRVWSVLLLVKNCRELHLIHIIARKLEMNSTNDSTNAMNISDDLEYPMATPTGSPDQQSYMTAVQDDPQPQPQPQPIPTPIREPL